MKDATQLHIRPARPEEAERPETLHRACELLQDLDNYQRITEDSARCIRTCQYAQRGLEGEILNAQKEEDRPSLAP